MEKIFSSIPKWALGPIVIALGMLYLIYDDPPRSVCDLQNEIFFKENEKYLYGYQRKGVQMSAEYKKQLKFCQDNNSPGACFDWLEGIKMVLHSSRNIPNECGAAAQGTLQKIKQFTGSTNRLTEFKDWMSISLYTFSQISWNESQVVRKDLFNWLDAEDISIFCRMKKEYIRMYGDEAYIGLQNSFISELIRLKKKTAKEVWDRTVLSRNCSQY